ncbi:hypothetical protein GGF44_003020 [Coemansia sp. RSA 1694]|nr:hypothetical protein GGF44_003020 [Coemansia sp. RSA 1694]
MVHSAHSILPQWYAECKFLQSESIRMVSDRTDSFIFGHMFRTPTNPEHRDANHLRIDFCHLEFPWDCNGVLADPPHDIAAMLRASFANTCSVPRCTVDYTLTGGDNLSVVDAFEGAGYQCDRGIVDLVMCLDTSTRVFSESMRARRVTESEEISELALCNARSFSYDIADNNGVEGAPIWLVEKLSRQARQPDSFRIYALDAKAFVVVYLPWEKSRDLALVQVIGTDPRERRRGLAYEVLAHALKLLPCGVKRVYLEAADGEVAAIALYEKLGFRVVGRSMSAECFFASKA